MSKITNDGLTPSGTGCFMLFFLTRLSSLKVVMAAFKRKLTLLTPTLVIKHRVKPSFCNFWHPGTLTLSPDVKNYK